MLKPERACLAIADITGYTRFLAGAELDHAQDILADLMGNVVTSLRQSLRLAKLEGDAVFVYAITDAIDGPGLQDTIERSYFAFRRRLRDIRQASSCECNACILVPDLDLKFVLHHGPVAHQRIGTSEELVGSDVIVVHRLLKTRVTDATGIAAYALYTDACLAAMALDDPSAAGMIRHEEAFDDFGVIGGWVVDLKAVWATEQKRARLVVQPKDALRTYQTTIDAPPALVWEHLTSPRLRPQWQHGVDAVMRDAGPAGRRGIGTVNHCMHGKDAVIEEVLDWEPNNHVTYRTLLPIPDAPKLLNTFLLTDLGDGRTHLEFRIARPRTKRDQAAVERILSTLDTTLEADVATLATVAAAAATAAAATELAPEPDLPASRNRMITEPMTSAS